MEKEKVELTNEQKLIAGISFDDEGKDLNEEGLYSPITFGPDRSGKDIVYLVFYYYENEEQGEVKDWEEITGRENLYEFIKGHVETMDIHRSKILTGSLTLDEAVSVYEVMKSFEDSDYFPDDNFSIEDYN